MHADHRVRREARHQDDDREPRLLLPGRTPFGKADQYRLEIIYSDKYSKEFIEHIAESFKLILHDFVNADKLSDINYTTQTDLEILDSYNETEYDFKYSDILDAFNDNLAEFEHNTLVGYKNRSYTHGESAFIADKIAGELTEMNIHHKDFVSLFHLSLLP